MSRLALTTVAIVLGLAGNAVAQQPATTPTPAARVAEIQQAPPTPRAPGQLLNIRLDLSISEQRETPGSTPRVVTIVLADRENGRVRSGMGNAMLGVDARPEIVKDGKIRVALALEYRPAAEGEKGTTLLTQSVNVLLDDGKPLVVSQSADPSAQRNAIRVELKATVVK